MLDIVYTLLGDFPPGLDFLALFFAFVLVLIGLACIAYLAHLPLEFIRNKLKRR